MLGSVAGSWGERRVGDASLGWIESEGVWRRKSFVVVVVVVLPPSLPSTCRLLNAKPARVLQIAAVQHDSPGTTPLLEECAPAPTAPGGQDRERTRRARERCRRPGWSYRECGCPWGVGECGSPICSERLAVAAPSLHEASCRLLLEPTTAVRQTTSAH